MNSSKKTRTGSGRGGSGKREPLATGRQILDTRSDQVGVVLEHACQYAHPKADPVYNYLIRWEDGQVQAISEAALADGNGYEIID